MSVETVAPYVFPKADTERLGIEIALRIREMLQTGSPLRGFPGLNVAPLFINRAGTEAPRDTTDYVTGKVKFPKEPNPGIPFIELVSIRANGGREEWGDDQFIVPITVVFDCNANEFMPVQADVPDSNAELEANRGHAVLSSWLWAFVTNWEVMTEWGFTVVEPSPEAPPGMEGEVEFHAPMTITTEVYVLKA